MSNNSFFILLVCVLCCFCNSNARKLTATLVDTDKFYKYQKYLSERGKGLDTIVTMYHGLQLDQDTMPTWHLTRDSLEKLSTWLKKEIGTDISSFLMKNPKFIADYYKIADPYATGEEAPVGNGEPISMCHLITASEQDKWPNDVGKIFEKMGMILSSQDNGFVEFSVSTAPPNIELNDIIIIQRNIFDTNESCALAHLGMLRNNHYLNEESMGFFQNAPSLNHCVGYFENTRLILIDVPILIDRLYVANLTCTLMK